MANRSMRITTALLLAFALLVVSGGDADAKRRKQEREPAPALPGELVIFSTMDGPTVEIDGVVIGTLPLEDSLAMEAGQHRIRVSQRGYSEYIDTFTVESGEEVELEIDLIPFAAIVQIVTAEAGATVKVDGKVEGVTPFDKDLQPGKRVIAVSRPGYFENVQEHQMVAGQVYDLTFDLEKMPVVEPPPVADDGGVHEQWWFWTAIGVAVAGGAAAAIAVAVSGGGSGPPTPHATIDIP